MNTSADSSLAVHGEAPTENEQEKIRVLIADDHPVYREGLAYAIGRHPGMTVIGETDNGKRLVEMARQHQPHVVLSDIKMPVLDGIAAVKEIMKMGLDIRCILISQYGADHYISGAIAAGASGYLVKTASRHEITDAVLAAFSYRQYFCRFASAKLKHLIAGSIYHVVPGPLVPAFNERDKQIISLICQEKSSKVIGDELFMSARTVEGCKAAIMNRIGANTTVGIVLFAIRHGIYDLDGSAGD